MTDECHRSIYGVWRQVLEYFDAHLIGLTATPSKHTLGFFYSNLVAEYPYEQSVVDGVNVGFSAADLDNLVKCYSTDNRAKRVRLLIRPPTVW